MAPTLQAPAFFATFATFWSTQCALCTTVTMVSALGLTALVISTVYLTRYIVRKHASVKQSRRFPPRNLLLPTALSQRAPQHDSGFTLASLVSQSSLIATSAILLQAMPLSLFDDPTKLARWSIDWCCCQLDRPTSWGRAAGDVLVADGQMQALSEPALLDAAETGEKRTLTVAGAWPASWGRLWSRVSTAIVDGDACEPDYDGSTLMPLSPRDGKTLDDLYVVCAAHDEPSSNTFDVPESMFLPRIVLTSPSSDGVAILLQEQDPAALSPAPTSASLINDDADEELLAEIEALIGQVEVEDTPPPSEFEENLLEQISKIARYWREEAARRVNDEVEGS
jgi:hypothetical protein